MSSDLGPDYELQVALVELLRGDTDLHALLFPSDRPAVDLNDYRVFEADVDLPTNLRSLLPRVTIAVSMGVAGWEQDDLVGDMGPMTVYVHHFTEADESERIARMANATSMAIAEASRGSTGLAPARIIASQLFKSGDRVKDRQPAFNDARRITDTYIARNVGVV